MLSTNMACPPDGAVQAAPTVYVDAVSSKVLVVMAT
jgi:hypothetical protein